MQLGFVHCGVVLLYEAGIQQIVPNIFSIRILTLLHVNQVLVAKCTQIFKS